MRVLIVDEDEVTRSLVRTHLRSRGHVVEEAATGKEGLWLASELALDAVVLDRWLPDTDGLELVRTLRARGRTMPVVMCSVADEEVDHLTGLAAGADDYLGKPFAVTELEARLHGIVSRAGEEQPEILRAGDIEMSPVDRLVHRSGRPIALRPKEMAILELLLRSAGQVVSREDILEGVWGTADEEMLHVVDVHVWSLRLKIDRPFDDQLIEVIPGVSCRLETGDGSPSTDDALPPLRCLSGV